MMIHKKKAVDREKRRQQQEKQRLISRVEAILAGVEVTFITLKVGWVPLCEKLWCFRTCDRCRKRNLNKLKVS